LHSFFKIYSITDSSALQIHKDNDIYIDSAGNWSSSFNENNEYNFGNNSIVDVEVDMNKKTIHYFINTKLCPYFHSYISSSPLVFGISAKKSHAIIKVLCVKKMRKSFVNFSGKCKAMKWK
jgi:hypothetical protein